MLGEHHFALLANDSRLSDEIRDVVEKASGEPLLTCALAVANDLLTYDTDGLLLLAAKDAADAEQIRYIVQEISLRQSAAHGRVNHPGRIGRRFASGR